MSKHGSPEHRKRQSEAMRKWFSDPANREAHAERQRKRFSSTEEGRAHIARNIKKSAEARKAHRLIPEGYEEMNNKLRKQGVPAVKRLKMIQQRMEEEARQYD